MTDKNIKSRCDNCTHWDKLQGGLNQGACRRFPPTVLPTVGIGPNGQPMQGVITQYPITSHDWVCGEYKAPKLKLA